MVFIVTMMGILEFIWTFILFFISLSILPFVGACFLFIQGFRILWMYVLINSYKNNNNLEFIKTVNIRTLMDSFRNPGIFTFLVSIHGECRPHLVKKTLFQIVDKRDKFGKLMYPRLQQCLISIWGCYAWKQQDNYRIENNFQIGKNRFRGRPLTEYNLQEYISETVSKYLPNEYSPWQVVLIPNVAGKDMYYILLRIHHLLLSEEKNLRISDLLMVKQTQLEEYYPQFEEKQRYILEPKSPLLDIFTTPKAIPTLYVKFTDTFSNYWNEYISIYDPLENIELLKSTPTIFQFYSICLITFVSIIREYIKDYSSINNNLQSRIKYFCTLLKRETQRRQLSIKLFIKSFLHTINPKTLFLKYIAFVWRIFILLTLKVPILLYYEIAALYECIALNYCLHTNTIVAALFSYIPLIYNAFKEILYCINVIINAPKVIINEIFFKKFYASPQTIKSCGRKVISWTEKLDRQIIRTVAKNINVTDTEVILSAIGAAITQFLSEHITKIPESIPITARNINNNYLYANNFNSKPNRQNIGGVVCLNLPLIVNKNTSEKFKWIDYINLIHADLNRARSSQQSLFALSKLQTNYSIFTQCFPSIVIKLVLNYLSSIYTIAVTEMTSDIIEKRYKTTIWGSEIDNIIFWRPPQSNISLSLCVSYYADSVTLAVMSDFLLSPSHITLGKELSRSINQLIEELNIA